MVMPATAGYATILRDEFLIILLDTGLFFKLNFNYRFYIVLLYYNTCVHRRWTVIISCRGNFILFFSFYDDTQEVNITRKILIFFEIKQPFIVWPLGNFNDSAIKIIMPVP